MKSLSLMKPLVIVTIGVPGAGKSFFARQFADTFSAPVISYDQIRSALFEAPTYSKSEQTTIQRIADYQLTELLKTKKTFLLDGGCASRAERAELRKRVRSHGYDVLLVWVQTDQTTAQYRSMKRSARKSDDQYNPSLTSEQYSLLSKRFSPPLPNESTVVISGKHTYPTQAKIVLKKLVVPREEHVNSQHAKARQPIIQPERPASRNLIIR